MSSVIYTHTITLVLLKYVHEICLLRWISVKSNQGGGISCPACNYTYVIESKGTVFLRAVEFVDKIIFLSSPYIVNMTFSVVLYAIMTLYGLHTVLVVFGTEESAKLLGGKNWTWRSWLYLPLIPVSLVVAKMSSCMTGMIVTTLPIISACSDRADSAKRQRSFLVYLLPWVCLLYDHAIRIVRARVCGFRNRRWPLGLLRTEPSSPEEEQASQLMEEIYEIENRNGVARFMLGAFLLPTFSSLLGRFIGRFNFVRSLFPKFSHRSILGGCIISVVEDLFSIAYCRQLGKSTRSRRIRNCPKSNGAPGLLQETSAGPMDTPA